ncbi:hypothetical protein [Algoriphagus aquimarinus]|uniref:HEAT repeat domain-containing protein n=1 Tax=Algoriphagus aquimarinus TaxID=237018 RepID=A0A1I0YH14_9BACT|nr:hypothetical protein [Algoriphagus aquimarinus]SFB12624.1 hypothetical protein SAMN04489723_104333 [Algoriphagus aquimarinus]
MRVKNAVALVSLLFLMIKTGIVLGQEEQVFPDSISFADFLKVQGKIPGLQFRLVDYSNEVSSDSVFNSLVKAGFVGDFASALTLKDSINNTYSRDLHIQYLIYSDPNTFEATQEYVSNLLRNGDIEPTVPGNANGKDLISLASRNKYSPFLKGTYTYFSEVKIFAVSLVIILFFVFAFSMILFMLIFKARRNQKEKLLVLYDEQIVAPLSEILFEKTLEELESLSDEELNGYFPAKQLKKPFYVQVLVERVLALNKTMKGDFKLKLKALYKRLDLDKFSIKKLKTSKWDTIVTGLVEINEMDLTEAIYAVKQHINSPNFYVRSQAVATILTLSDSVDLSFLRDQTFPLSRWQQMNYLRIIKFLHTTRDLHIETLFDSKNQSIRLFGYKLVRVIGRVDLLAILEEKSSAVSEDEKIEIIKTFEYLGVPAHTELINGSLKSENIALVSIAAKAAGAIGDATSTKIICELLTKEPEFRLKMVLLTSLQDLDETVYNQFVSENDDKEVKRINMHLSDSLLQDV